MSFSLAFWAKALATSTVPAATKTSVFATEARQLNNGYCGLLVLMQWSLRKYSNGLPAPLSAGGNHSRASTGASAAGDEGCADGGADSCRFLTRGDDVCEANLAGVTPVTRGADICAANLAGVTLVTRLK